MGPKQTETSRVAVPQQLRQKIMQEYHDGRLAGHFSGPRLYKTLVRKWWWPHMYTDAMNYTNGCPQCAIVEGTGRRQKPLLQPIVTERPFQIVGVDIMELPVTTQGNRYAIVFQDLFTKWPLVFPAPDQKVKRIAQLLVEEIVPTFGVPEAILSDRGANLLSFLMKDVCKLLGIKKLNTTASHPQCNGAVERFNRTLKSMLRKQAAKMGAQWDQYLSGVLWAYRNTPHSSTGEKPSYLLFGFDCRSPTESAPSPAKSLGVTDVSDYREQMVLSLSTARSLAMKANREAQQRYKLQYDKTAKLTKFRIGDWVLIYFPQDETGKSRKLSHPWHMMGHIELPHEMSQILQLQRSTFQMIYQYRYTRQGSSIVLLYTLPSGFYWYGTKRPKPGRPSKKLLKHLVPLVMEADLETLSSSEKPAETGNSDQLIQPGSNDGTFNSNKKCKSSTLLSSNNQAGKLIESQRSLPAATTTCKQRDENKETNQQANNPCPYLLRSRNKISKKLGTSSP